MNPSHARLGKYACIEIALSGRDLRPQEKREVRAFFLACDVLLSALACTEYRGAFRWSYYTRSFRRAGRIQKRFRTFPFKKVKLRIKILGRHDWFDKWKRDYHIRPFGDRFLIVPVWEKKKLTRTERIPIFLEPGSAFGSGYHETTRLMIRLLETLAWKDKSFLDVGTGTGILSVAVSKLGAQRVLAFDNDRPSVTAAWKNFKLNGCSGGKFFGANLKKLSLKERFGVVGANLLSKTLLEGQKQIKGRVATGGYLIVSGIGKQNLASFQEGFHLDGMKRLKILKGRKWVALLYRKP